MPGPDLPRPDALFTVDTYLHRWPTGAEKAELFDGVLVFSGQFDERDIEIAQRAYPNRWIILNEDNGIEVHPAGDTRPLTVHEAILERQPQKISR